MGQAYLKNYLSSFAGDIRRIRKFYGFSREELAERAGIHPNTVAVAERGERDLNTITQTRLFAALGCREVRLCDGCLDLSFAEQFCCRADILALDEPYIIRCIGEMVRRKRLALDLTLEDLASLTGLHLNSLWNCENGLVIPKGNTLVRLYQALGIRGVEAECGGLNLN